MFNNDQISSAVWFFFGSLVIYFSIPYGVGTIQAPETGFMPLCAGFAICFLAVGVFVQATLRWKKGTKWENPLAGSQWAKPLIALVALVIYTLVLPSLGFVLSTAILVGVLLRAIQPQGWLVVVLGALLTSLICYLVFQVWLRTQLPSGPLGF
jgi:hypothetical protein